MPWRETAPVEQRDRFIDDDLLGFYTMTELCARYAVSRKTGSKWVDRYDAGGRAALVDRSRAPHTCPHKISGQVAALLVRARRQHPDWGAEKLLQWLEPRHPRLTWPAVSPAGDLLARHGLVKRRRRRRPLHHPGVGPPTTHAPHDLWAADFKGQFRTDDRRYCYPLTVTDQHTRFLIGGEGRLSTRGTGVRPIFDRLFREYGLPRAMRTDNGVPFASTSLHGLTPLNVWGLRLGIQHPRLLPAHPQQNGAHERMHKTLKRGACRPPRATLRAQQRAFDRFRAEYNDERPHQFLGGQTPGSQYRTSPRPYTSAVPPLEYPSHFVVKRVTNAGTIRFKTRLVYLSTALRQHRIGLEEVDDGIWSLFFCDVLLGRIDERKA
ncbi:MAG: transposase, partial [Candidatus Sericytochromatia bacterium]|nr:transposase [Candidatus Tanganyikabacteria bacterium]